MSTPMFIPATKGGTSQRIKSIPQSGTHPFQQNAKLHNGAVKKVPLAYPTILVAWWIFMNLSMFHHISMLMMPITKPPFFPTQRGSSSEVPAAEPRSRPRSRHGRRCRRWTRSGWTGKGHPPAAATATVPVVHLGIWGVGGSHKFQIRRGIEIQLLAIQPTSHMIPSRHLPDLTHHLSPIEPVPGLKKDPQ